MKLPNFSATKTVFVMIAMTVCYAFLVSMISEQAFMGIVAMVFMAYYKGEKPQTPAVG
jgi:hypothetical protein